MSGLVSWMYTGKVAEGDANQDMQTVASFPTRVIDDSGKEGTAISRTNGLIKVKFDAHARAKSVKEGHIS